MTSYVGKSFKETGISASIELSLINTLSFGTNEPITFEVNGGSFHAANFPLEAGWGPGNSTGTLHRRATNDECNVANHRLSNRFSAGLSSFVYR